MPGVRFDRFLASTAVALLLSAATAGGALAEPKSGVDTEAMPGASSAATPKAEPAPAKSADSVDRMVVKPALTTRSRGPCTGGRGRNAACRACRSGGRSSVSPNGGCAGADYDAGAAASGGFHADAGFGSAQV